MSLERFGGLRAVLAEEAARLMYREGVKEYFTAKRMAARRVLGRSQGKNARYRPRDLPSNGEIRDALLAMAELAEGDKRTRRLFAMRVVALEAMMALEGFHPRLIGSVSTGHIRHGSDIDIQVFTDGQEALELRLTELRWTFEKQGVTLFKFGELREYLHYHVVDVFPVELTCYHARELRFRPRSSTDGKPIVRLSPAGLRQLIQRDHGAEWLDYEESGAIAGLDELLVSDAEDPPGAYDALIST